MESRIKADLIKKCEGAEICLATVMPPIMRLTKPKRHLLSALLQIWWWQFVKRVMDWEIFFAQKIYPVRASKLITTLSFFHKRHCRLVGCALQIMIKGVINHWATLSIVSLFVIKNIFDDFSQRWEVPAI